ncbi:AraC family transcriptional regulator [Prevotella sp. 10(H)]|uniref:helix-turn-helix domain-containing protein n=1 Tax=Prevotella sp. 10(H) TaxID=1158294 RepID=UPI0004A74A4F|nr:helix-turn-helix domain-containing protein [Prevotella sp. 10(H)]
MEKKLSVISFDDAQDSESFAVRNYSLTNSLTPPPASLSFDYPFLAKGMLFGICLRGETKLKIDLKEYLISPNSIFTVLPNQIFEALERTEDHFSECIFFSVDFMNMLPMPRDFDVFNKMKNNPCIPISEKDMKELIEYHSFIMKISGRNDRIHKEEIVKHLLHALIALIASLYAESEANIDLKANSRGEDIVDAFQKQLMEHHRKERNASFYSDKLCISTQYLSRTLKKITGRSVNLWITEAVILEAKILLKSSEMTVLQISEELNFPNPSFFVRYFKQYAGITPLKFRER